MDSGNGVNEYPTLECQMQRLEALVAHYQHLFQKSQKDCISNKIINGQMVLLKEELVEAKSELGRMKSICHYTSKCFAAILNVAIT
jgi:hypothetical protein